MSYSNSLGSVFVPTGTIIPIASINSYNQSPQSGYVESPPSGYVYCDGYYYTIEEGSIYYNLYKLIGTKYGSVTKSVGTATTEYFRVPNLMGQTYDVTDVTGTYSTPNAGVFSTTIGGINNLGTVNTATTITLTADQLPDHSHQTPASNPNPTLIVTANPTHTHTITEGTISVTSTDGGHTHGIDSTINHNHDTNNNEPCTLNFSFPTGAGTESYCLIKGGSSTNTSLIGIIDPGQNTGSSTTGITVTESNTVSTIVSTPTVSGFSNSTDPANYTGYATVNAINTDSTGSITPQSISIPVMPSFIMNYLIKL